MRSHEERRKGQGQMRGSKVKVKNFFFSRGGAKNFFFTQTIELVEYYNIHIGNICPRCSVSIVHVCKVLLYYRNAYLNLTLPGVRKVLSRYWRIIAHSMRLTELYNSYYCSDFIQSHLHPQISINL